MTTFFETVTERNYSDPVSGYGVSYGGAIAEPIDQDSVTVTYIFSLVVTDTATDIAVESVDTAFVYKETAVARDSIPLLEILPAAVLEETAIFNDSVTVGLIADIDVVEVAAGNDGVTGVYLFVEELTETAEFVDATTAELPVFPVSETAVFTDAVVTVRTSSLVVSEQAAASDAVSAVRYVLAAETAEFADAAPFTLSVLVTVTESAVATDSIPQYTNNPVVLAVENAAGADAVSLMLTSPVLLSDEAFVADQVVLDDEDGGYIWTANLTTWAMSRYVGTPFTSMVDDLATTNDELLRKDGGFGNADVLTGNLDVGAGELVRLRTLYMYGDHAAPLTVDATADVDGARTTTSYTQMARDAGDSRAVRCTLGRGYRSQRYQFRARSTGEATMRMWVAPIDSARRRI